MQVICDLAGLSERPCGRYFLPITTSWERRWLIDLRGGRHNLVTAEILPLRHGDEAKAPRWAAQKPDFLLDIFGKQQRLTGGNE